MIKMMVKVLKNRKVQLFLLLSLADLLMTAWLLTHKGERVYEGNPVADWWLTNYGWAGMAGFKLATVGLVAAVVAVLFHHRPRTARRVLTFACAALAFVVLYSGALAAYVKHDELRAARETMALEAESERLSRAMEATHSYLLQQHAMSRALIEGRLTLGEAVGRLLQEPAVSNPDWLRRTRERFPGRPAEECVRLGLVHYTRRMLANEATHKTESAVIKTESF